jgi:uncharacterized protein involved in outer membrane biogenesis
MMRRAIIVLSWAAGVVVVLLLTLIVIAVSVDADAYRPRIERELTQLLGREISAERLSIGFSLFPTLAVRELRIANPPWASRPYFLTASNVDLTLDLVELLHGRVEIGAVNARGLDLALEQGTGGFGNWEFGASASGEGGAGQLPDFDLISLRDSRVTWRGVSGEPVSVSIETADAVVRANKPFELKADFVYRQVAFAADLGSAASLQNLLHGEALAVTIALRSRDASADMEVTAPRVSELGAASINFSGKGKRLDAFPELAGDALPEWGPYRVSGTATFAGGGVHVTNLRMFVEGLSSTPSMPISRIEIDSGDVLVERTASSLQLAGKIDESSFRLGLTTADPVGGTDGGTDGAKSITLTADLTVDDFSLGADGTISYAARLLSFDFVTGVRGDIGVPARLFGAGAFIHPVRADLSARLAGDATRITAQGLRGTVAGGSVAGDLTVRLAGRRWFGGTLKLGRLDVSAFELEQRKSVEQKKGVKQTVNKGQRQHGPDTAEPEWMRAFDADLQLQIESIVGLPLALSGLSARGILQDGSLSVEKFSGVVNRTAVLADGALKWKDQRPYLNAKIRVPRFEMPSTGGAGKTGGSNDKSNAESLDTRLPLALLRMFDADITLETGRITGLPVSVTDQRGSATLRRGRLRVPQMNVTLANVPVVSTLVLDAANDGGRLRATLSSGSIDVADLVRQLEVDAALSGKVGRPSATVDTHGITLREWIRNAKVVARADALVLRQQHREADLALDKLDLVAAPGVNTRAESRGRIGELSFDLTVTGGPLADLLDGENAWPKVVADARMVIREKALQVTASSALDALRRGRDVPLRIDVRSSNTSAVAKGIITDLRDPARSPLDVEVRVKSLANLPPLIDQSLLPDIPFAADAKMVFGEDLFSLDRLVIRAGESDLSGQLRLYHKDRMKLVVELSGNLIDLKPWVSRAPEEGSGKPSADERVAGLDQPFDLAAIREYDADLRLKARRLLGHDLDLEEFSLQTTLDNGLLELSAATAEGQSRFMLQVNARGDIPVVGTEFSTTNLDRDTLIPESVERRYKDAPRISARVQLAAHGTTPREVYASSRGDILIYTGPGRVRTAASPLWYEAISSDLLETLAPGKKPEDYNSLECAAAYFSIADGVASSPDGIALRFKRMDLLGSGAVNLSTRELLFGFKAVRRKWWSFSILELAGDFATIGGTIEQPKVGLDPENIIVQGGAAWATLGISLLATNFFRKLNAAEDPCAQIVEGGRTASTPIDDLLKGARSRTPAKPR